MFQFSLVDTAFAQAAAAAPKGPSMIENLALPVIFLLVMYIMIIRPQQKRAREHSELINGLKVGDEVVTSGGIVGRVRSVADAFVTIESLSSSFKVMKANVIGLTKSPEKPATK
ncbi:MAG: preprotein translocase subunit YajC [Pseudomonadota bacterium]|jgi:preprotein translocase subunit YajC